jgi:hypothetical protein
MRKLFGITPRSSKKNLPIISSLQKTWDDLHIAAIGDAPAIRQPRLQCPRTMESEESYANWSLGKSLFQAIAASDVDRVLRLYSDDAAIDNPITGHMTGEDIRLIWRNLIAKTYNLKMDFDLRSASPSIVEADWTSDYIFIGTGRRVKHSGTTCLSFQNGRIVYQIDDFDLWHWSRQAFVPSGLFLGWTPAWRRWIQTEVRRLPSLRQATRP